jgi:hypothetical protein
VILLTALSLFASRAAWADDEHEPPAAEAHEAAHPGEAEPAAHPAHDEPADHAAEGHQQAEHEHADHRGDDHEATGAEHEHGDHAGEADAEHHDHAESAANDTDDDGDDADGSDPDDHFDEFDPEGTGHVDRELEHDYKAAFAGIAPLDDKTAAADEQALEERPADSNLQPSMTIDAFRNMVRLVKQVVLGRMEKKLAKSSAAKMSKFSKGIFWFSLLGVLLLAIPLVGGRKYPGKRDVLLKYSLLAAATFFVTVNLFGGVLLGMRSVQGALGAQTNPSMAIAKGTFDTLDRNADEYVIMGKELFAPTLEQLRGNSTEQPSVVILENGQRLIKDARVFVAIAHMFKKLDFVFKVLPIVLFCVTMLLFGLAIRPTLTAIVKLPMRAASGAVGAGREVMRNALQRVKGELIASLCTIGVLVVMTLVSGFVLGRVVAPALDALLHYFSRTIEYLQFIDGASSGLVFDTLITVILFLVMNLVVLIVAMSIFLGKSQKIFQQRFNDGVPLRTHSRFFRIGVPAVLLVHAIPLVYSLVADRILVWIDHARTSGTTSAAQMPWAQLLLAGPVVLLGGFALAFWAARGFKALGALAGYKVKPAPPRAPASDDAIAV